MTTSATQLNEKTYGQLLRRTLPHVIHTEEEYERFTAELMGLDQRDSPSTEERELAQLLTMLIEDFEERRYPIGKAEPHQVLLHLMEARGLTQKDLWKIFGSRGITSEVVRGKRSISKTQARKLAEFFHVGTDLFI
jgi:HTH-type transcriptional regulator/antitoxin HigA